MPRAFRFGLQKVLDYRVRIEQLRQAELADLEMRLRARREALRKLEQSEEAALERMRTAEFDLVDLQLTRLYIERLGREIARAHAAVAEAEGRVVAKREELIAASRDRKAMERLRERERAGFLLAELRAEQKLLDELGGVSFVRAHLAERAETGADS